MDSPCIVLLYPKPRIHLFINKGTEMKISKSYIYMLKCVAWIGTQGYQWRIQGGRIGPPFSPFFLCAFHHRGRCLVGGRYPPPHNVNVATTKQSEKSPRSPPPTRSATFQASRHLHSRPSLFHKSCIRHLVISMLWYRHTNCVNYLYNGYLYFLRGFIFMINFFLLQIKHSYRYNCM